MGHEGKTVFGLSLIGLILSWLTGTQLDRNTLLLLGGGIILGLGMWTTKVSFYRGLKIEIVVEADSISFSRELLKHPGIWSRFRDGLFVRVPWTEITRWDFTDPDSTLRGVGWYPTEYSLQIRSAPGTILILDREPLIEVEDQFIPRVRQILLAHGHNLYGLDG